MAVIIIRWFILTLSILAATYLVAGIEVTGFFSALAAAALLSLVNGFLKPILIILTLPLNIVTLGLFTFFLNAFLFWLVAGVIPGVSVTGFGAAFFGALVITLVNWLLGLIFDARRIKVKSRFSRQEDVIDLKRKGDGRWE